MFYSLEDFINRIFEWEIRVYKAYGGIMPFFVRIGANGDKINMCRV